MPFRFAVAGTSWNNTCTDLALAGVSAPFAELLLRFVFAAPRASFIANHHTTRRRIDIFTQFDMALRR